MVNKKFGLVMLALALSLNLVLIGCDNPETRIEYVDKITEVNVPIEVPIGGMDTQNVATQATLVEALDWVKNNYEDFNNYIIDLKDYDAVSYIAPTTLDYPDVRAITLTLTNTGTDERIITLRKTGSSGTTYATADRGSLFTIRMGFYLVIDGKLTLKGIDTTADGLNNNAELIDIGAGGRLVMKGQSKISGNTNSSSYGGGVYVARDGVFIMEGGEITGNKSMSTSGYGGGVHIYYGTFVMTGGSITGNAATSGTYYPGVGGVYIDYGTFTMTGGSISGNTVTGTGTNAITGVYLSSTSSSIFKLSGSPQITDTVCLYSFTGTSSTTTAAITLIGAFNPAVAVPVDLLCYNATAYNNGNPTVWDNKAVLKWDTGITQTTFPVEKFALGKYLEDGTSNSTPITGKSINSTNGQLVND